ncbi:hypothetical protein OSB04_027937 [Centaurea solstitialis]|uniref:Uncharacterized protein n=1 Tax=Centaurea solstitialis TaxID=347529 RepID=A0AA38WAP2_9ASTR|nr:hypothetical protein OSB04_027937 [Centaurea solstitialis]
MFNHYIFLYHLFQVRELIEQCLVHYITKEQIKDILYQQQKIPRSITECIWESLEADNPDFFKAYYLRLVVNGQIREFNNLLGRQAQWMVQVDPRRASSSTGSNESHTPARPSNVSYYASDTGFAHKMENMQHRVPRVLVNGFNGCGPSIHSGMHHALDRSTHFRRMDVPSYMMLACNSNVGLKGIGIKSEGGYLDNSRFVYNQIGGNVLGAHPTIEHAPISPFGSVDPNSQTRLDDTSSFEYFRQVSQNIGLPGLAADFTNRSGSLTLSHTHIHI